MRITVLSAALILSLAASASSTPCDQRFPICGFGCFVPPDPQWLRCSKDAKDDGQPIACRSGSHGGFCRLVRHG